MYNPGWTLKVCFKKGRATMKCTRCNLEWTPPPPRCPNCTMIDSPSPHQSPSARPTTAVPPAPPYNARMTDSPNLPEESNESDAKTYIIIFLVILTVIVLGLIESDFPELVKVAAIIIVASALKRQVDTLKITQGQLFAKSYYGPFSCFWAIGIIAIIAGIIVLVGYYLLR